MKLEIPTEKISEQPEQLLRRAGYGSVRYKHAHEESWARRFTANHYPRFHVYIKRKENNVVFDLHLDQKEASYSGNHMHSAEYDGDTVATEIARLRSLFLGTAPIETGSEATEKVVTTNISEYKTSSPLERMKKGTYSTTQKESPQKKSWWRRFLG